MERDFGSIIDVHLETSTLRRQNNDRMLVSINTSQQPERDGFWEMEMLFHGNAHERVGVVSRVVVT